MPSSDSTSPSAVWLALKVLIVRLRFFLVLFAVLLLVGVWPMLRQTLQRMTDAKSAVVRGMDDDLEFWCPMCPGVVSDWPSKCPVCNMALVRRKKGEAVPLPDGVLARMQFSPYRVQLAGIRTANVEYRPLRREIVLVGLAERSTFTSALSVRADVFLDDLPFLSAGQSIEARSDALAGHAPFRGKIAGIEIEGGSARKATVRLEINDPNRDLRSGTLIEARAESPLGRLPWWRRTVTEEGQKESAADVALHLLLTPTFPSVPAGVISLLRQAGMQAMLAKGHGPAVPCSAVIDRGSRKVVFVESGAGMFDAVEIAVGPRCGDFYPVLQGVDTGQRVAAAGAFLLDAEMWLNHDLAASYFGATRSTTAPPPVAAPSITPHSTAEDDRLLAAKQKICPVSGKPLDSMGGPVRLVVDGRIVFICCKGCEAPLREEPAKYLTKLPAK